MAEFWQAVKEARLAIGIAKANGLGVMCLTVILLVALLTN